MSYRKRRLPFIKLSRRQRRALVISLKNKIRRNTTEFGGLFTSHQILNDSETLNYNRQWFDFYFISSDKSILWNACIITAKQAFRDEVSHLAHMRLDAIMTREEKEAELKLDFIPFDYSKAGKILTYKLITKEKKRYKKLDGLTYYEELKKLESEIECNEPPFIYESFRVNRSYVYGIGLEIIIDTDSINQSVVEDAISRFYVIGETDWVSQKQLIIL
ncbi:hypothetical protein [Xenorhabdus budapestensis]|uniref:Uncharacterized protein n=1 Tax=Xenorhabdus budapestensis TaxID=290110 RepID=A0A2D0IT69_XENBU|nr:hypothetical protein [Xenorhabdus budapestensis]PHM25104.1 hypothetical protein Xbud_03039 [Xenorhabdus budapestensis]